MHTQPGTEEELAPDTGPGPPRLDRLQAWATLLPAACLVLPLIHGVPTAASAGVGWCALASLPAALLLVLRRPALPHPLLLAVLAALLLAGVLPTGAGPSDRFEASRAHLIFGTQAVLLASAASLDARGRTLLARGLALASLTWVVSAWVDTRLDPVRGWAGMLENTGDLSEAALAGAVLALALARDSRGVWRVLLPATLAAYATYTLAVPVHAGALSLLAAAGCAVVLGRRVRPRRAGLALAAGLVVVFVFGARVALEGESPAGSEELTVVDGSARQASFGGVAFRRRTWPRTVAMILEQPVPPGSGQFAAAFPPWRNPADIEAASFARRAPYGTEVEHPHNDYLLVLAEHGLFPGILFLAFLTFVALRAVAGVRESDPVRGAFALAALALLVNASASGPLFEGPAAHAVAAVVFGTLLQPSFARSRPGARRVVWAAALVLFALELPRAKALVEHGSALAALSGRAQVVVGDTLLHDAAAKGEAIARALAAAPDSVVAHTEQAFLLRETGASEDEVLAAWREVLARRPWQVEALVGAGNALSRLGHPLEARSHYANAARIDPQNPTIRRNRLLLAVQLGDAVEVAQALDRLGDLDAEDRAWLERTAGAELLRGRPHLGLPLLARLGDVVTTPEEAIALAEERGGTLVGDGLEALANQLWARDHVRAARYHDAVRLYRQSLRVSRTYGELQGGSRHVRFEMAAAQILEGEEQRAREELAGLVPDRIELSELPGWASAALAAEGLLGE